MVFVNKDSVDCKDSVKYFNRKNEFMSGHGCISFFYLFSIFICLSVWLCGSAIWLQIYTKSTRPLFNSEECPEFGQSWQSDSHPLGHLVRMEEISLSSILCSKHIMGTHWPCLGTDQVFSCLQQTNYLTESLNSWAKHADKHQQRAHSLLASTSPAGTLLRRTDGQPRGQRLPSGGLGKLYGS